MAATTQLASKHSPVSADGIDGKKLLGATTVISVNICCRGTRGTTRGRQPQGKLFQNNNWYMEILIYFRYDLRGFLFNFKRSGMSRHGTMDLSWIHPSWPLNGHTPCLGSILGDLTMCSPSPLAGPSYLYTHTYHPFNLFFSAHGRLCSPVPPKPQETKGRPGWSPGCLSPRFRRP